MRSSITTGHPSNSSPQLHLNAMVHGADVKLPACQAVAAAVDEGEIGRLENAAFAEIGEQLTK